MICVVSTPPQAANGKAVFAMARNKYVKDYRILESVDRRGRIKAESEYIGEKYYFTSGQETARRQGKRALALCALGWLFFVGAMLPSSGGMRTVYVSLPFVFSALPLGMLTALTAETLPLREPLEHRHADKLENGYPVRALFTAVMPALSLLGEAVKLFVSRENMTPGDGIFALCALALAACGGRLFSKRRFFVARTKK